MKGSPSGMRYALMTLALVLLAASASPVMADTLYTTGGTPPTFVGQSLDVATATTTWSETFSPSETATLTDAILPLQLFSDPPGDTATVYIESTTSGAPSGTVLDTLTTATTLTTTGANITFTCSVCSQLVFGTTYAVLLQQNSGTDQVAWLRANPVVAGTAYLGFNGGSTAGPFTAFSEDLSAFEIDGTPVASATPEASSLLLLSAGLLGLLIIGRKRLAASGMARA